MDSIDLIAGNLRRSDSIVLARVEDMRGSCMVPATPGGAHTLWLLGHLAYIEGLVIRQFMLGEPNGLAGHEALFDGDAVSQDTGDYPAFDEVLASCREQRALTHDLLASLTETDLDRESRSAPDAARELFGTWRDCLQYAPDHWLMHRGQLADARRAAGLARAWY